MDDDGKRGNESVTRAELEAALRFIHAFGMKSKHDLVTTGAKLDALLETLVARGLVTQAEVGEHAKEMEDRRMDQEGKGSILVWISPIRDKYQLTDLPVIDCDSRMPLCQGRCCAFQFHLSLQDVEESRVRWNYGQPYLIAHGEGGRCVHQTAAGPCGVYQHRPATCRTYDCRQDKRVWLDFDKRIPAPMPADVIPLSALVRR